MRSRKWETAREKQRQRLRERQRQERPKLQIATNLPGSGAQRWRQRCHRLHKLTLCNKQIEH